MFGRSDSKSLGIKGIKLVGLKLYCFFQAIMTALKILLQYSHITPADSCHQKKIILASSCECYQKRLMLLLPSPTDILNYTPIKRSYWYQFWLLSDCSVFTWNIYTIFGLIFGWTHIGGLTNFALQSQSIKETSVYSTEYKVPWKLLWYIDSTVYLSLESFGVLFSFFFCTPHPGNTDKGGTP